MMGMAQGGQVLARIEQDRIAAVPDLVMDFNACAHPAVERLTVDT
jgi:hypothetical protein